LIRLRIIAEVTADRDAEADCMREVAMTSFPAAIGETGALQVSY
jgi:hypothetical protein